MSLPDSSSHIDIDAYAAQLRRHSRRLLGAALIVGLAVAAGYALLGKHRAEGVYTLGAVESDEKKTPPLQFIHGIAPQAFKTIAPRFDANGFAAFIARIPDASPDAVERLARALAIDSRRRQLFLPVYGTTRGDLRELGESAKAQDNAVLGLLIVHAARDRNVALEVVRLAGDFVGDTVLRAEVHDTMQMRARETEARRLLAENILINARFEMGQLESKGESLARLRDAFPELMRGQPQQVISVAEGGQRFLSPAAQVVGVESMLADHRERITGSQRQMRKGETQAAYYHRALALAAEPVSSTVLLQNLSKAIAAAFPTAEDPDGVMAEARNEALLELGTITALRTRGLQFIVEPAIAEREPGETAMLGALAALAVLVLGMLALLFQQWLHPAPRVEP